MGKIWNKNGKLGEQMGKSENNMKNIQINWIIFVK